MTTQNGFADIIKSVGESIVRVEGRKRQPASGIVVKAEGIIVTCDHVVRRDEGVRVGLADGTTLDAHLVGRDPSTDLAVLRIAATDLKPATWATKDAVDVGAYALALGRPNRFVQASLGIVSAKSVTPFQVPGGGKFEYFLRPDLVMYPGFSGGALMLSDGEFAGVNTSAMMQGEALTIPSETVLEVVKLLVRDGQIKRGFLGISAQVVRLSEANAQASQQETGLLIISVDPAVGAGKGGMFQGDVMLKLDGQPTRSMEELRDVLMGNRIGQAVEAVVIRGGEQVTLSVEISERE